MLSLTLPGLAESQRGANLPGPGPHYHPGTGNPPPRAARDLPQPRPAGVSGDAGLNSETVPRFSKQRITQTY
jgi:hypothetical protein